MLNNSEDYNNHERLKNTHVPDKVYAYSLQVRHMLYELLDCTDNEIVSIEVFDDVAIEKGDGSIEAVQIKSVLSNNNPISNRAVDLWKTFYNWLIAVQQGELPLDKTIFRLFIAANKKGEIANSFSEANNKDEALKAWENAKKEFYDEKGNEKNLGKEYAHFVRNFFNPLNKCIACNIIENFRLDTIEENHTQLLFEKFKKKSYFDDDIVENAFIYILGWIDFKTATLIEQKQVMSIDYSEFRSQMIAVQRDLNQKLSLKEIAPKPSEKEIEYELNNFRTYLEQLEIIDCDYTDKIEAINDYLRASTNRTIWAKRGDITYKSLEDYEENLIRKWRTEKKRIDIIHKGLTSIEKGNLLYLNCKEVNINMDNLCVPGFFTAGCYHVLSDNLVIGWHPDYKSKLKIGRENDGSPK